MVPRVKEGVRVRREKFGALVFTNRTPILTLNEDALAIWRLIDGARDVRGIIDAIVATAGARENVVAAVEEFVLSCVKLGLLDIDQPEG